MKLLPDKQLIIKVPFQSTKNKKTELCVDKDVKKNLAMYFVQHIEMKFVFTFQPSILPVSTTVESAKPALLC